jgi:hypothetical protein
MKLRSIMRWKKQLRRGSRGSRSGRRGSSCKKSNQEDAQVHQCEQHGFTDPLATFAHIEPRASCRLPYRLAIDAIGSKRVRECVHACIKKKSQRERQAGRQTGRQAEGICDTRVP